jgi:predicted nucleotidyltransferase
MTIGAIKTKVVPILKGHQTKRAAIFGSIARGEAKKNSDIDILIELPKGLSLFDFVEIQIELEEALGKKVHLTEYCTIKPAVKKQILSEAIPIL